MVDLVKYALENAEKGMFLKFRSGQLSLGQVINRIDAKKTGRMTLCLDDIKDQIDPDLLKKNCKYAEFAYREEEAEK